MKNKQFSKELTMLNFDKCPISFINHKVELLDKQNNNNHSIIASDACIFCIRNIEYHSDKMIV